MCFMSGLLISHLACQIGAWSTLPTVSHSLSISEPCLFFAKLSDLQKRSQTSIKLLSNAMMAR